MSVISRLEHEWTKTQVVWVVIGAFLLLSPTLIIQIWVDVPVWVHVTYFSIVFAAWIAILYSFFGFRKEEKKEEKQLLTVEEAVRRASKFWKKKGYHLVDLEGETLFVGEKGFETPVIGVVGMDYWDYKYYYLFWNTYNPDNFTFKGDFEEKINEEDIAKVLEKMVQRIILLFLLLPSHQTL